MSLLFKDWKELVWVNEILALQIIDFFNIGNVWLVCDRLSMDLYINVFEHEKACRFKNLSADLANSWNISKLGVLDRNGE